MAVLKPSDPKSVLKAWPLIQGSKKNPSGRPGQVDFPLGQVTFSLSLPDGQGPRQAVRRLNFDNNFEKKR